MNKKTLRIAGWALGLSMAVAGIGVAVGASYFATEPMTVMAKNGDSLTGGDCPNSNKPGDDWTNSGTGTYSNNGIKFDGVNDFVKSPDIHSYGLTNVVVKMKAGYNGSSGSTLTIAALDSNNNVLDSEDFVPNEAYTSQTTINTFELSTSKTIYYIKVTMKTKTSNLGVKYLEVFDNTPVPVEKGFNITGITSSGLYLKNNNYPIGYEAVGFDSAPTITDVVWTVPSGAGSITDGIWTTGSSAMENVTLRVELKVGEDDYYAEVTTNIDEVVSLSKNNPTDHFASGDVFTVGNPFNVTYTYAGTTTVPATDPGIIYRLETSGREVVKNLVYNTTILTVLDSKLYVEAVYGGVGLTQRYSITVAELFDNTPGAYYLVENESELFDGDHITFYGYHEKNGSKKHFVPTTFANNNIQGTAISFDNGAIDGSQDFTILDFQLEDTKDALDGSFAFMATNNAEKLGKYLYAASSSANQLKTQDSINENARFVIDIDGSGVASVVASGSSNRKVLSSNGINTDRLFSCYASVPAGSGEDINKLHIYKWVSNADKVQEFIDDNMKMDDYTSDHTYSESRCNTNYGAAKTAFNALTASQRALFVSEGGVGGTYEAAYNRLVAWATANHESIGTDGSGNENVLKASAIIPTIAASMNYGENTPMVITIATIATIGAVTTIGGLFLIQRKRRSED
ncbi:MAG: hypothetical protein SPL80_03100 [Bacilli bacterium]|nr:hypothetical protein [Bacilli bacterium]